MSITVSNITLVFRKLIHLKKKFVEMAFIWNIIFHKIIQVFCCPFFNFIYTCWIKVYKKKNLIDPKPLNNIYISITKCFLIKYQVAANNAASVRLVSLCLNLLVVCRMLSCCFIGQCFKMSVVYLLFFWFVFHGLNDQGYFVTEFFSSALPNYPSAAKWCHFPSCTCFVSPCTEHCTVVFGEIMCNRSIRKPSIKLWPAVKFT